MGYNNVSAKYRTNNKPKVRKTLSTASRLIVERTPDLYDKSRDADLSKHLAVTYYGNQYMLLRNTKRTARRLSNLVIDKYANNQLEKGNLTKGYKWKNRVRRDKEFHFRESKNRTIRNQSRKILNKAANVEDNATKTTGIVLRSSINTWKYRKQLAQTVVKTTAAIKSIVSSLFAFVVSIPGIIAAAFSSIPLILISLVILIVMSVLSSTPTNAFNQRISTLIAMEGTLNSKYSIEINIVDILSITYALNWSDSNNDKIDRLVSYMYCEKPNLPNSATQVDFETALVRVFKNYNPALNLNNNEENGLIDQHASNKNSYVYKALSKDNYEKYFSIYPDYAQLPVGSGRQNYGSENNIETLKNTARSSREYNQQIYNKYLEDMVKFSYGNLSSGNTSERARQIFPAGVPISKDEMKNYLITIQVPILDKNGNKSTAKITCNKAISNLLIPIYQEMIDKGFRAYDNACFNWRKIAGGNGRMSNHSWGLAIDINVKYNPQIGSNGHDTGTIDDYDSTGSNHYSLTPEIINIWKKRGFYWGGDYKTKKDYMHIEYINGSLEPGRKY